MLVLVAATVPRGAHAQMPDLRTMSGKPLPVADLAAGTVTVRVARQLPANAVAGAEVTAIVSVSGEGRKRVATTGADGRATFDGLPLGATFKAEVTVDGERLQTAAFPIPPQGGTRIMLIAALGSGGAAADPAGGGEGAAAPADDPFARVAITGTVTPVPGTPAGSLAVSVTDAAGRPVVSREVRIAQVGGDKQMKVHRLATGADGVAQFQGLPTGEAAGYIAVVEHEELRLGTQPFRLPADSGARAEIRALDRTTEPSALRIDRRSQLILDPREDALAVAQSLVLSNPSDKIFDPGERGLLIPLPEGFRGAESLPGGAEVQVQETRGVVLRTALPPNRAAMHATLVRYGFVVPADGTEMEYRQPMPMGMEAPFIVVPEAGKLELSAPTLRSLPDEKDKNGNTVKLYELAAIPPGGTLSFTVKGLASRDHTTRNLVGVLCLGLILGCVVAVRVRSSDRAERAATRESLVQRREKLFAELVDLEKLRRAGRAKTDASLDERRRELVAKLELVYRELAQVEEGRAPQG